MLSSISTFIVHHYTLIIVMISTALIGCASGVIGTFAVLQRKSLLGDALAHATLPGIVIVFLATYTTHVSFLLIGGAISSIIGMLCMTLLNRYTKLKLDAILGIILSVFFGCGLIGISEMQKRPIAEQGMLNKFIFGNASTLLYHDLVTIVLVTTLVLSLVYIFWKECVLYTFDTSCMYTLGYRPAFIQTLLTTLLLLTICIGLQTVGIILMSSMLIAPAAAARQWTHSLSNMTLLAALIGSLSAIIGSLMSSWYDHVPTGPMIVIILTLCAAVSCCRTRRTITYE